MASGPHGTILSLPRWTFVREFCFEENLSGTMNSEKVFQAKRCAHSHDQARSWRMVRMKPLRLELISKII